MAHVNLSKSNPVIQRSHAYMKSPHCYFTLLLHTSVHTVYTNANQLAFVKSRKKPGRGLIKQHVAFAEVSVHQGNSGALKAQLTPLHLLRSVMCKQEVVWSKSANKRVFLPAADLYCVSLRKGLLPGGFAGYLMVISGRFLFIHRSSVHSRLFLELLQCGEC